VGRILPNEGPGDYSHESASSNGSLLERSTFVRFSAATHGSLDSKESKTRTKYVSESLKSYENALKELGMEFELRVYGIASASLVSIDVDLTQKVENALLIPRAMIDHFGDIFQFRLFIGNVST